MTFDNYDEFDNFLKANPGFTGVCVFYHSNGRKKYEYNFVNGKYYEKLGWYSSGRKWFRENRINGYFHGKQSGWYNDGRKWYEHNYVNGINIGIQFFDGETYETEPEDNSIWYVFVREVI